MNTALLDDATGFDEPGATTAITTTAETKSAIAITDDIGRIKNAIGEFDRVTAGLAALEAAYPKDVVYEVSTPKGMKAAIEHRAAWRDPRITVEKARKMAKAPVIALGKNIDARAAWLTEKLLEGETPVDRQIKAEEARREAEREAKAAAEFGRVLAIQEALGDIATDVAAACNKTSGDIGALLDRMKTTHPDPAVFQEMMDQAKAAWAAGITKLETAHKAKLWEESEQRRVAAELEAQRAAARLEAEKIEAQRLENERIAAEQARVAAEQAEKQRQIDEQLRRLEELENQRLAEQESEAARLRAITPAAPVATAAAIEGKADNPGQPDAAPEAAPVRDVLPVIGGKTITMVTLDELPALVADDAAAADIEARCYDGLGPEDESDDEGGIDAKPAAISDTLRDRALDLKVLADEARKSRFPAQPKMGPEWFAALYAAVDALAVAAGVSQ